MAGKKKKKGRLPKKIAGVKLPKEARRQAERAIAELKQPIVREMIVGALGIAASAIVKQVGVKQVGAKQAGIAAKAPLQTADPKPEPARAAEAAPPGKSGGEQFAEIASGLAMAGLGKLFEKMAAAGEAAKKAEPPKV